MIKKIREIRLRLSRIARRFVESPRFRNRSLAVLVIVLCGIGVAVTINPLQRGLKAGYYNNIGWSGEPMLTSREHHITLWRIRSKFVELTNNYSIRWTGAILIPSSGEYQFSTISDDSSEVYINNQLVVDNRGFHAPQERRGMVYLEQGFYPITIQYIQGGGDSMFRIYWTPPGKSRENLSQASLFVNTPARKIFLAGRILEIFAAVSTFFCVVYIGLILLIWLNNRRIIRPFLRDSFIGRGYGKFRAKIVRDDVVKKAYPAEPKSNTSSLLLALAGYTVLSLAWTYPLIRNFSTHVVGLGGDRYVYLWNMWWTKKALLELHTNPLYTDYLFYPGGINLAFHDFSLVLSLISLPLQGIFTLQEIYNLLYLSSYILAGFGCFLLVRYLTGDNLAAFLSGIVFAFWGGRVFYVDHLYLASIQWIPFCGFYLIKTFREQSYRNPILAALFLVINALTSWYYSIYMGMFAALFLLYTAWIERKRFFTAETFKRLTLMGAIFIVLMLPVVCPMLSEVLAGQEYMNAPVITDSASPEVLFLPGINHGILEKYLTAFYMKARLPVQKGLNGAHIGYITLFLCLYSGIKLGHLKQKFWITAAIFFLLLSFGPYLRLFSKTYSWLPLPYLLLEHIPILKTARVPVRFMVMVIFCCSVLAGYASWDIFRRIRYRRSLFSLLAALILFEFFIGFTITPVEKTPEFYQKEIRQDQEEYAILELTRLMGWEHSARRASLFQITHGKKLFHGFVARIPPETYHQAYAIYTVFDDFFTQPREFVDQGSSLDADRQKILALLSYYNVRYVALYYDYWHGTYGENFSRLKKLLGEPVAKHRGIQWFKVDHVSATKSLVFPGFGMFPLNYEEDEPVRQAAIQADIKVLNIEKHKQVQIRFAGKAYHLPEEVVEVSVNGTEIATVTVGDWTEINLTAIPLKPGDNTIRFRTKNGHRKYGIRMRNLAIELVHAQFNSDRLGCFGNGGQRNSRNLSSRTFEDVSGIPLPSIPETTVSLYYYFTTLNVPLFTECRPCPWRVYKNLQLHLLCQWPEENLHHARRPVCGLRTGRRDL